jgi:hypothetical protein
VALGPTAEVIDRYLGDAWDNQKGGGAASLDYYRRDRNRVTPVRITGVTVDGGDGGDPPVLRSGEPFTLRIAFTAQKAYPRIFADFRLVNQQGERVATFLTSDNGFTLEAREGPQEVACRVEKLPLAPGRYTVTIGLNETTTSIAFDVLVDFPAFHVVLPELDNGALEWPHRPWGCLHWTDAHWSSR